MEAKTNTLCYTFPKSPNVYHFNPIAFVEQMKLAANSYNLGDEGEVVKEINFRLAGFDSLLPGRIFTAHTEKAVKQFQRDYMDMANPTGEVDPRTLAAIDEFSNAYREDIGNYKCKCGAGCTSFGNDKYSNQYGDASISEMNRKYEYPGIHQSLLWAVSASRFYFTIKLQGSNFSIRSINSGYRCWEHSIPKKSKTTNHMGKAVDISFNKNGVHATNSTDMKTIRDEIYCECIGAPKQGSNTSRKYGWMPGQICIEPVELGAVTYIHIDVREIGIDRLLDEYFIKKRTDCNFNKELIDI